MGVQLTSPCATSSVQLSAETHAQGALRCEAHSGGESSARMELVWVLGVRRSLDERTCNCAQATGHEARGAENKCGAPPPQHHYSNRWPSPDSPSISSIHTNKSLKKLLFPAYPVKRLQTRPCWVLEHAGTRTTVYCSL